jgi:serine O-acetyltransferase
MELSLSVSDLKTYVANQLNHFFPDNQRVHFPSEDAAFEQALMRTEYCLQHVTLQSYKKNGQLHLNHLYSDQWAVFIWFLSNSVWRESENETLANKLFYLNKALHGFSCLYNTELPDIFLLLHTVGIVLGKAKYENFLVATQGSTVGAHKGHYPSLGKGVALLPYSSIIGGSVIGDRVSVGIRTSVYLKDVPSDTVVYTSEDGSIGYKLIGRCWSQNLFSITL